MKNIKIISIILIIIFFNINYDTFAQQSSKGNVKNVLIINSYNIDNKWEKSIIDGFKDVLDDKYSEINIKMEYLDIGENKEEYYVEEFKSFINSKYKDENFDVIIAIDDEAFNLIREAVFDENSMFYKKTCLFIGVNQQVNLTKEEKEYITGFIDVKNQISLINLIINLHPDVDTIKILIDNTIYSENIKLDSIINKYLLDKDIKLEFIEGIYTSDVIEQIKNTTNKNEVLIISGIYKDKSTNLYTKPKDFIKMIKDTIDIPIYTDRQDYINTGIIGGYVDIGVDNGMALGKMTIKILETKNIGLIPITIEPKERYIIDYDQIYKYNINPLEFPEDSIIINKKMYELLIPKELKRIICIASIIMLVGLIYIIYQIYVQRRNSIKNKKLYQMAKDREQLKTDFIVNMSHELRTPLNVITSITKLLEVKADKEDISTDYLKEKLERINQNSNRLTRLVNNLIDITKFESGFYEVKYTNENIVYLVEDIVSESIDFANQKNIDVVFDTEEEEIETCIDKEKIERVVLNIISNAIKYTPNNGKIEVFIKKDKSWVIISIKDNGVGIPKDKLEHIFYRFYQVDSLLSRSNEGSGIGLCIADEIVKMHGGEILVESVENEGSEFEIVLPIKTCKKVNSDKMEQYRELKDIVKIEMSDIDK